MLHRCILGSFELVYLPDDESVAMLVQVFDCKLKGPHAWVSMLCVALGSSTGIDELGS